MKQASLKEFEYLIKDIDECNASKKKIRIIAKFIKDIDPSDGC